MPQFFIDRPVFAWVVALFIVLAGALALRSCRWPIPRRRTTANRSVRCYPGASAQTVGQNVASLIEEELNGADRLIYYESHSATAAPPSRPPFSRALTRKWLRSMCKTA